MNEVPQDSAAPRGMNHYCLLTIFCLGSIMALGWAFRLEQTAIGQYLSLVETTDSIKIEIMTAHLLLEEFLDGDYPDTQPDAKELTLQHLYKAQRDISAMLDSLGREENHIISLTDDPGWQRQVGNLQKKLAAWYQIIGQMDMKEQGTDRDRQLGYQSNDLFISTINYLSSLTSQQHTFTTAQMQKMRMVQAALLTIGLVLIVLVVKIFKQMVGAQLTKTQKSQKQLLRRMTEMSTLNALGRLSNIETSPELFAKNALKEITALLRPDIASISLRHEEELVLLTVDHPLAAAHKVIIPDHKILGECLCGLAAQGQPVYSSNIHSDVRCTLKECKDAGLHSFAALPLVSGEKVIGILGLGYTVQQDLAAQHLLLESLADQLASGLQNCLLYDLSQQQSEKMREQINLLSLGADINAALTQSSALREMLDACCSLLVRHLGASFARIWVMKNDDTTLELQASAGIYTRIDGTSSVKTVTPNNKIGAIALSKQPYLSNQLLGDPQIVDQDWVRRENMVAFAGHPLMLGDKVIGVLAMFAGHPLSEIVNKMLASIADAIALAIDNKQAVHRLQRSHERYRDLIENISDWIWTMDEKAAFTFSSPQVSPMLGYGADEIIGLTPFDLMPEGEAERFKEKFDDITASQRSFAGLENIYRHQDGHRVILETSGSPIFDAHGFFMGYRGMNRDVTARKTAENTVLDQKRMLEAMFNAVPDAMIFTNTDHQAKMTNYGFFKLFGYADDEMLDQDISLLYDCLEDFTQPDILAPHEHEQEHEQLLPAEINFKRKNGEVFPGETVGAAIKNTDGQVVGFLRLIRDISLRKQAEASQRHTQKMEALGTLSGGIAHDFNNLLNVINGYTALTIDDLDHDGPAVKNLQEVVKASERAVALVRQILAFSKGVEEGKKPLFLHHITKEVAKLMVGTLPTTIEIKQSIDSKCRAVLADASQIHQVLMNLCTNAYHAMRDTGGILEIRLSEEEILPSDATADLPAGSYAKLIVRDTGHGMDKAVLDRIFEPYFTTKKMGEGTGLGLATAHGIIKGHGGRISVFSEIDRGTTFTIYLPIIEQTAAPEPERTASKGLISGQLKANILFVDDVAFNVDLGEQILTRAGCQVTGEIDSTAALALFAAAPGHFDLVITDQTMPKLTGIDMAKEMLALRPDLPIIMVTGHSETVDEKKAKEAGIRELLSKPLKIDRLLSTVDQILQQTGPRPIPAEVSSPMVHPHRRRGDKTKVPAHLDTVREHLNTTYGVNQEQIGSMLQSMQETLRLEIVKARAAASQNDVKALALAAHTIKGILLNAGLAPWADLAKALETSAADGLVKDHDATLDELGHGLAPLLK